MLSLRDNLIILIASFILGAVGSIPIALLALIFGNADVANDMFLLSTIIVGSWFPLKLFIDSQVKGQLNFKLPNISLNQLSLFILVFAAVPAIIFLYFNTVFVLTLSALLYRFTEAGLLLTVVVALLMQVVSIYRGSQREKAMGVNNNVFVRVQDFGSASFIQIDPDQVQQQTPRQDKPPVIYLPEDNLRDRATEARRDEQPPMTINLDPSAVSEQSDDEA